MNNYSKNGINNKIKKTVAINTKYGNKMLLTMARAFLIFVLFVMLVIISTCYGVYKGIIDNAPTFDIASIVPMGYATTIYDSKGNVTDTLVMAGSNRQEATYDELFQIDENGNKHSYLIDAFVAIEDSRFWSHNGIDTKSIARAIVGVLQGSSSSGGGSTLTQQLIKNNVFEGGRESTFGERVERKFQEQYLAVQLEKNMSKEDIITNYLNTINLGNNSLGVKVAARRYFNKEISELTLSECAVIAGITQNPSRLNPISGQERNAEKRLVILQYMYEQGYITKEEQEEAANDDVYERIQNVNVSVQSNSTNYSYFTDELTEQVIDALKNELGYTDTQAYNMLYSGGLSIYTTQDPDLQTIVDEEVNDPSNYSATRYSAEYRLSVQDSEGNTTHYSEVDIETYHKEVLRDSFDGLYDSEEKLNEDIENYKAYVVAEGDTILGESLTITLEPQVSFVLIEQSTGHVKAISGGRGEKSASLTLNRATNTYRQPGSTFKVVSAFAPAIDKCGQTLASVYYDAPYKTGNKYISNWYSSYLGWSNIREGIIYSMNIVAVKCFMNTVTADLAINYSRSLGITSLTETDYNGSTALGGITYGVSNLELTGAYAAMANGGAYNKPVFFTKILDHNGNVLIENTVDSQQVMKSSTAFLLSDAMAGSMVSNKKFGSGVNSTSTRAHLDNMSCAGKSGTTTGNNDIWFVGYTPYYTAGIWAGCDNNQKLTSKNGGTSFHKNIWKKIMTRVHEGLTDTGFTIPSDIETALVCRKSGKLAVSGVCEADPRGNATYTEYFAKGTTPIDYCDVHDSVDICDATGLRANEYCPTTTTKITVAVPEASGTNDSGYTVPIESCNVHTTSTSNNTENVIGPGANSPSGNSSSGPSSSGSSNSSSSGPSSSSGSSNIYVPSSPQSGPGATNQAPSETVPRRPTQ